MLLKKAAVDDEFRGLLFKERDGAATAIHLQLEPAECAMLKAIPDEQLRLIINQTSVPVEQRRVFLGQVAAAMLATISAGLAGCRRSDEEPVSKGIRPNRPTQGIAPDRPQTNSTTPPSTNAPSTNTPNTVPSPATRGVRPDRP